MQWSKGHWFNTAREQPENFQSALPVQNHSQYLAHTAQGIAVGVWDTTTMQEASGPYPGDEFIVVLEGSFSMLDGKGGSVSANKGQSVCFRNAIPLSWKQDGYLKKFYITWLNPTRDSPKIASMEGGVIVLDFNPQSSGAAPREQIVFLRLWIKRIYCFQRLKNICWQA